MKHYNAILKAVVSAALFGMAAPFSKFLLSGLQSNQLAGLLYIGAAIFLFPIMVRRWCKGVASFPSDLRNRWLLIKAIFFGGVLGPTLLLVGLRNAPAASVSMWLGLETVTTAVIAAMFFREHLGKWTWLCNAGILTASLLVGFGGGRSGLIGILLVGGAAIAWGLDNNFTALIDGITPEVSTFWKGLFAGIISLAIGFLLFPWQFGGQWLWAMALGGVSYGASISLYISASQSLGAARSQMIFASSPFFGIFFSAVWLGESISSLQIIAAGILLVSFTLLFLDKHRHEHFHELLSHEHEHGHDDAHHLHNHEGRYASSLHSHEHIHEAIIHSHPHWPDIHHRHQH